MNVYLKALERLGTVSHYSCSAIANSMEGDFLENVLKKEVALYSLTFCPDSTLKWVIEQQTAKSMPGPWLHCSSEVNSWSYDDLNDWRLTALCFAAVLEPEDFYNV